MSSDVKEKTLSIPSAKYASTVVLCTSGSCGLEATPRIGRYLHKTLYLKIPKPSIKYYNLDVKANFGVECSNH